jgi:hypothetical protein
MINDEAYTAGFSNSGTGERMDDGAIQFGNRVKLEHRIGNWLNERPEQHERYWNNQQHNPRHPRHKQWDLGHARSIHKRRRQRG